MKSIFASIWFWIFAIGFLLIVIAALIGGGMKKINGWVWGLFIIGIILFILGILFAFLEKGYSKDCGKSVAEKSLIVDQCELNNSTVSTIKCSESTVQTASIASPLTSGSCSPGASVPLSALTSNSPMTLSHSPSLASASSLSPMGSPTKISCNVPQAMRGFVTTSADLSSLAPN